MSLRSSVPLNYRRRKLVDLAMRGLTILATLVAVVPLVLIIGYVLVVGGRALNWEFFTQAYKPPLTIGGVVDNPVAPVEAPAALEAASGSAPGATADPFANLDVGALAGAIPATPEGASGSAPGATADPFANLDVGALAGAAATPVAGPTPEMSAPATQVIARGGVLHGIVGTLLVAGLALLISVPIGLLAGVFLSEFPNNQVATAVRFCCDVLSGAPSIIVGVVAYVLLVQHFKSFSGVAGSVALTFLMVPTITRTTEEILKLVPNSTREAALAVGAPTWYSTFTVVVPAALSGIVTGVLLAFARGAGETAPLILTVLGNSELSYNLLEPIAALPLLTYRYTESPFPSENNLAWGSAFVLMMLVLLVNILVRLATRNRLRG